MFRRAFCSLLALLLCLGSLALADESALLQAYDMISPLDSGLYAVRKDGLWGVADTAGNLVLEPQLEQEPVFQDGLAIVSSSKNGTTAPDFFAETHGLRGAIDEQGNVRIPFEYDTIEISEGIVRASRSEEYFFLDLNGRLLAGPYAAANPFQNGRAAVAVKSGEDWLWGVVDASGAEIIPCAYIDVRLGSDGPVAVCKPGEAKYGFVDMQGNEVIPPKYDNAAGFTDGYAPVGVESEEKEAAGWGWDSSTCDWGAIDEAGNEVLPCEYDTVTVHPGGILEARRYDGADDQTHTTWFEVRDGVAVETDAQPNEAEDEPAPSTELNLRPAWGIVGDGELLLERRDGLWRLVDLTGAPVLDMLFCNEPVFEDHLAAVSIQTGKFVEDLSEGQTPEVLWGLIDDAGQIRIPAAYDELKLSEGVALVKDGEKYAFLNSDGTPLTDRRYFRAEPFHDGYAQVGVKIETAADESFPSDTQWGVIDSTGAEVVPCEFDFLELGDGGTAVVSDGDNQYGYIGMDGESLFDARFDSAHPFVGEFAVVGRSVEPAHPEDSEPETILLGVIDRQGGQVLSMEYDEIELQPGGLCRARLDGEERWYQLSAGAAAEIEAPAGEE